MSNVYKQLELKKRKLHKTPGDQYKINQRKNTNWVSDRGPSQF